MNRTLIDLTGLMLAAFVAGSVSVAAQEPAARQGTAVSQGTAASLPSPTEAWNNLEITKLAVSFLTPIVVAVLGFGISRRLKRLEQVQWASQKAIEKRLEIYSDLAPVLNDLYCYFNFIGDWKMKDPGAVLGLKRCADRIFHVNSAIFTPHFQQAYKDFIDLCFIPGPLYEYDTTATLKTDVDIRKDMFEKRRREWNPEWDSYFAPREDITSREKIVQGYKNMMDAFVQELGVDLNKH